MNDLQNFMQVASCQTLSEAALKLGITQPSLSESIKRLESDLNEILLYRSRAGVSLTPNGRAVHMNAQSALSYLTEIESVHNQGIRFGSRVITVGCHPTVASYCLPAALTILQQAAPDYKINLKHDLSRSIQTEIQQGRIDIGIVINPTLSPDMIVKKVATDEMAVWTSKSAVERDKVFCNQELIQTQAILRKWKAQPATKINTDSLELIVRLVEAGLGYGILPERVVKLLGAHLKRVESTPVYQDTIAILYRPEFGKSKIERELIRALHSALNSVQRRS